MGMQLRKKGHVSMELRNIRTGNVAARVEQYRSLLASVAPSVRFSDVRCFARDTKHADGMRIVAFLKDGREVVLYD